MCRGIHGGHSCGVGTTFFALGAVCANAIRDRSEYAVNRLVHDRAPHPMKLHHHSGSLFFPLREGRPVQMHLECGGVPVHFVHENFRIVVFRQQDFELQGARFIFQACLVRTT